MRAVVQRVRRAAVHVEGQTVAAIAQGLLVLLGVAEADTPDDAAFLSEKIVGLRIFQDDEGKMNRAVTDVAGQILVVSQFTLLGDCRKGRRPSFSHAAAADKAESLYTQFATLVRGLGVPVATGRFGEHMEVELVNDGPVTLLLDSRRLF